MDLPAIRASALPGNRTEAYRAGMTPRIRSGTFESNMIERLKKVLHAILRSFTGPTSRGMVVKRQQLYAFFGLFSLIPLVTLILLVPDLVADEVKGNTNTSAKPAQTTHYQATP